MDFEKRICEYCHAHVRLLTGRKKCVCSYCGRVSYPAPPNFFNMRESDAVDYCNSIIKEDSERGFRLLESYAKTKNTIDAWYHIYYIARKQTEYMQYERLKIYCLSAATHQTNTFARHF